MVPRVSPIEEQKVNHIKNARHLKAFSRRLVSVASAASPSSLTNLILDSLDFLVFLDVLLVVGHDNGRCGRGNA